MTRGRKIFAWTGGVLLALVLLVAGFVSWVLFTNPGARWIAGTVTENFVPQVRYSSIDGTIAGTLEIRDFRFEGDAYTAKIRIAHMSVDPTLGMLFSRVLRIERATVRGLVLTLPEQEKPDEPEKPLWVEPPVEVVVRDFALVDGRVMDGREQLVSIRQLGIAAHWSKDALTIERLSLLPGDIEGSLSVKGRLAPQGQTLRGVLDAAWKDVVIPEKLAGRVLASAGELHFNGTPEQYHVASQFDLGPPGDLTQAVLRLHGTQRHATLDDVVLQQRAGRLAVQGLVDFQPEIAWNLHASADDFNPGALLAGWDGKVDLDFTTRGQLAEAGPRGSLNLKTLAGNLRGRPIAGHGDLQFAAPATLAGDISLSSGRSRVSVRGESASRIDATVDLAVASLNDWVPDTAGSLTGKFRVRGVWPKLTIDGGADGNRIVYRSKAEPGAKAEDLVRVGNVHVTAAVDTPLDPTGKLDVVANRIQVAGWEFSSVHVAGSGNQARHRATLDANGEKLNAGVTIAGGITRTGWTGELSRLNLDAPDLAKLALRAPASVVYDAGNFSISESCFANDDGSVCLAASLQQSGALEASYRIEQLSLGLANVLAPEAMPGQLRGELRGDGKVRRTADGQWFGDARIESPSARLTLRDTEAGESALGQHTWLIYENLAIEAKLEGTRAQARVNAGLDHGGKLAGDFGLSNLTAAAPALRGDVTASMPTLAPFAAFVPTVANLDGAVDAKIQLGGTITAPEFTGNVAATKLQADLGQLGIELREGEARAEAARGGGFKLAGHVKSGKGQLDFQGSMSERGVVDVRIGGQNFVAADIPAVNVVISPDLALTGDPKGYLLKGDVLIPNANINIQKMPQDEAPGVSPDVVVVRDGKVVESTAQESAFPLTAEVNVKLGDKIAVVGYGLDATVIGQLLVRESPGTPTTGSGQLTVSGTYKAYGQDLTIKDGRLLFAGTPLDNPRLSIIAMREIDSDDNKKQQAGLKIAGSAQRPVVTVISDPNVGEADALSYLVTGRSLSEVGTASGSSQDALASATQSLEGGAAGLVAKRIGKRLGLDEAGVEENEMIGGSALTIGEYLSPRLYLSYGVGLFQPGEVIALRYKISSDVGVKVQRGTEETRAGVEYRIEK
ncbi:MAG TPA: translocation/assembly module TamB domain-containing protein [Steroidobacteraceae bacterium]|nr:translocation/assembly module TamB domain-containing protein [Steroidobacteraceae bacterium]